MIDRAREHHLITTMTKDDLKSHALGLVREIESLQKAALAGGGEAGTLCPCSSQPLNEVQAEAMRALSCMRSAIHCGNDWDNVLDDAYRTLKSFVDLHPARGG